MGRSNALTSVKMMKVLLVLVLLGLACAVKHKSCKSSRKGAITHLKVSPAKFSLAKTRKLSVDFKYALFEPVGENVKLKVTVKKKLGFFWVAIPCSQIDKAGLSKN